MNILPTHLIILLLLVSFNFSYSIRIPSSHAVEYKKSIRSIPAAVMPGSAVGNAVIFQGIANGFSIYNSIIIFRIALSWFPQLPRQFPILRPVFTVTDPYLNFFRRQIPGEILNLQIYFL